MMGICATFPSNLVVPTGLTCVCSHVYHLHFMMYCCWECPTQGLVDQITGNLTLMTCGNIEHDVQTPYFKSFHDLLTTPIPSPTSHPLHSSLTTFESSQGLVPSSQSVFCSNTIFPDRTFLTTTSNPLAHPVCYFNNFPLAHPVCYFNNFVVQQFLEKCITT